MDVRPYVDDAVSVVAAALGEPARARIVFCLMDGHARTSTELAIVAGVSPSTASVHLNRLMTAGLVKVLAQGKHRFYSLGGPDVASALEALSLIAGRFPDRFVPRTPNRLRAARTCYDHLAGALGVLLHDRFMALGWISAGPMDNHRAYDVCHEGAKGFEGCGIDICAVRTLRRQFAFACLDWSERRPHVGGALGAAILEVALRRRWVIQDLDSRALSVTRLGRREMLARFGLDL